MANRFPWMVNRFRFICRFNCRFTWMASRITIKVTRMSSRITRMSSRFPWMVGSFSNRTTRMPNRFPCKFPGRSIGPTGSPGWPVAATSSPGWFTGSSGWSTGSPDTWMVDRFLPRINRMSNRSTHRLFWKVSRLHRLH